MTKEKHEKRLSQDDILRLCRNALTEIHRVDGLIVEKVLELYEYQQIGSRWAEGFVRASKDTRRKGE